MQLIKFSLLGVLIIFAGGCGGSSDDGDNSIVQNYSRVLSATMYGDRANFKYDDSGKLIKIEIDIDSDDKLDNVINFIYEDKKLIRLENDNKLDGTVDDTTKFIYSGDKVTQVDEDDGNDGSIDRSYRYTYNSDNKIIEIEISSSNNTSKTYISYNSDGNIEKSEEDSDGDGNIDNKERYIYENGRLIKSERDIDNDGTIDYIYYFIYDESGNISEIQREKSQEEKKSIISYKWENGECSVGGVDNTIIGSAVGFVAGEIRVCN